MRNSECVFRLFSLSRAHRHTATECVLDNRKSKLTFLCCVKFVLVVQVRVWVCVRSILLLFTIRNAMPNIALTHHRLVKSASIEQSICLIHSIVSFCLPSKWRDNSCQLVYIESVRSDEKSKWRNWNEMVQSEALRIASKDKRLSNQKSRTSGIVHSFTSTNHKIYNKFIVLHWFGLYIGNYTTYLSQIAFNGC